MENNILKEDLKIWMNCKNEEKKKMFCALERKYGIEEVISGMAQFYWDDIQSIEQNIKLCSGFDYKIRTKKLTIAAYYTRLYFAGTERAVSLICNK